VGPPKKLLVEPLLRKNYTCTEYTKPGAQGIDGAVGQGSGGEGVRGAGHGLVDGALADAVAELGAVLLVRLKNKELVLRPAPNPTTFEFTAM
jgi:hypothetical protein